MHKYSFSQGFSRCVCWAVGKILGFVVVSFLINPRPTPRICGILALRTYCFFPTISRCVCRALGKTLGFVVVSFLINPRPAPRILWNSGFAQMLFFPKNFEDAYAGHLGKHLGFVVVSFLSSQLSDISPRPVPRILWKSGFAQVLFSQGFSGCVC